MQDFGFEKGNCYDKKIDWLVVVTQKINRLHCGIYKEY